MHRFCRPLRSVLSAGRRLASLTVARRMAAGPSSCKGGGPRLLISPSPWRGLFPQTSSLTVLLPPFPNSPFMVMQACPAWHTSLSRSPCSAPSPASAPGSSSLPEHQPPCLQALPTQIHSSSPSNRPPKADGTLAFLMRTLQEPPPDQERASVLSSWKTRP